MGWSHVIFHTATNVPGRFGCGWYFQHAFMISASLQGGIIEPLIPFQGCDLDCMVVIQRIRYLKT
jgi:hypothetical protein